MWQPVEVSLIGRPPVEARMWPSAVVKLEVSSDRSSGLGHRAVSSEVYLLVFDRPPKPLDKDIVTPRAFAVHADGDAVFEQHAGELGAGELAALIRVEDFRPAMLRQSLLQRLDAELGLHGDRYAMAENPAAEPIDHGDEINKALLHRDVADIRRPYLIWPRDRQIAQEIRINLVPRRRLRGVRLAIDRFDRHALHQRRDVQASGLDAFEGKQIAEHPAARERIIQMQFVYPTHNGKIGRRHGPGQRIDAAPADPERLRLFRDGQIVRPVDHRLAPGMPALPSAPSKKSFSSVNSPIFAWSAFKSTVGPMEPALASDPNTPAAPCKSCAFHCVIWLTCTSNCCANSTSVFSPLTAAKATLALKAGLWFRRTRFAIVAPDAQPSWPLSGKNSTYPAVQICRASSLRSSCIIAAGGEVICAFGRFEDVGAGFERPHQAGDGSLGDLAQIGLQLRKSLLDRVHVRAVGRQISQFGPCGFYELFDPRSLCGQANCP